MPAAESSGKSSSSAPRVKKTAKAVSQVMAALKNSKSDKGPTMTEIHKFISTSMLKPATKKQVVTALKRGVEFGILKRQKGHYLISAPDEILAKPTVLAKKTRPAVKKAKLTEKVEKRSKAPTKPQRRAPLMPRKEGNFIEHYARDFPSPPTMTTIFEPFPMD